MSCRSRVLPPTGTRVPMPPVNPPRQAVPTVPGAYWVRWRSFPHSGPGPWCLVRLTADGWFQIGSDHDPDEYFAQMLSHYEFSPRLADPPE